MSVTRTRIKAATKQNELIAVTTSEGAGPVAIILGVKPGAIIGLDLVGIASLRATLDMAEAKHCESMNDVTGAPDAACEPSTTDRLFYKPQSFTMPNGEVRHFSPPAPFEPCPGVGTSIRGVFDGKVVKATHPAPPPETDPTSERTLSITAEMKRLAMMPKLGMPEPMPVLPLALLQWPAPGGTNPIRPPRYPQLTDWVRAQPEGARLLVCLSEDEARNASDMPAPSENLIYIRGHRTLFRELSSGHGITAVWLSSNVEPEYEHRIPNGVNVYREGEP